jgi:hypothetical protein
VTRRRNIEQVGRPRVFKDGLAKANIDWPRERAACRASFDNACPGVTDDADKQQNTKHSSEKTINQSRRCPHCEGQNYEELFPTEAETASERLSRDYALQMGASGRS